MRRSLVALVLAAAALASPARADDAADEQARDEFRRGTQLARDTQWGAALAAFERSAKLHPHAWTTYNQAICERALGLYVRARKTFQRALDERKPDADLPESAVTDTKRFLAEIDKLVAALDVTLEPADASIAVDGQPLEVVSTSGAPVLLAGTQPAGPGRAPPASAFKLELDPGTHVVVITREGFADAVRTETVKPGERRALKLVVERLPATIRVRSNHADAVVAIDKLDVGTAPVSVERPAGRHRVVVRKDGFDPYELDTDTTSGQRVDLVARLAPHKASILTKWWFWGAATVVVAGAVIGTYAATRPAPQRPPIDTGGLGWAVHAP